MWEMVRALRASGITIVLTTHYIEEAEEMADRVGVINKGKLILVEEKTTLMRKLGKSQLSIQLQQPLDAIPAALAPWKLDYARETNELIYSYEQQADDTGINALLRELVALGLDVKSLQTRQSSLEDFPYNWCMRLS